VPIDRKARGYRVRVWNGSGYDTVGYRETKKAARSLEAQAKADRDRGTYVDPTRGKVTLEQFFEVYISSPRYLRKTQGSRDLDRSTWNRYIAPKFGRRPLDSIRHAEVQDWLDGLGASRSTTNRVHRTLRAILNRAVHEEYLARNPALGCHVPTVPQKRDSDELAEVVWDVPELQAIVRSHPERYRAFVMTMATCGLRPSEAIGLRWPSVDLGRQEIHVVETVTLTSTGMVRGETKNKRRRTVPMTSGLVEMLREHRKHFDVGPDGAVFANDQGELINRVWFLRSVFRPALEIAGVHPGDVYSLRHSASSILADSLGIEAARELLGHSDTRTTERYTHTLAAKRERTRAALESLWSCPTVAPEREEVQVEGLFT